MTSSPSRGASTSTTSPPETSEMKPNIMENDSFRPSISPEITSRELYHTTPRPGSSDAPHSNTINHRPHRADSASSTTPLEDVSLARSEEAENADQSMIEAQSSSTGETGEVGPSGKRREANRLAAQRFRTRKKGYVEELEGKVAGLEKEKERLLRRIGDLIDTQTRRARNGDDPIKLEDSRHPSESISSSSHSYSHSRKRSRSPSSAMSGHNSHSSAAAEKMANLEAANRRLQEELSFVSERNVRLSEALDQWRIWERETRATRDRDTGPGPVLTEPYRPSLPPVETGYNRPQALPNPTFQPTLPPPIPAFSRGHSYHGDKSGSHPSLSPHFRLPPLRLAPKSPPPPNQSDD